MAGLLPRLLGVVPGMTTPAEDEARGIRALEVEGIKTVPLVGWGKRADGRSFIITEDLTGYNLHHFFDLATHFFTKTRWNRTLKLIHGYHDYPQS